MSKGLTFNDNEREKKLSRILNNISTETKYQVSLRQSADFVKWL